MVTGEPILEAVKSKDNCRPEERSNIEQHLLKLIVYASCSADHKTKSRWAQALRYVWRRRKHKHTNLTVCCIAMVAWQGVQGRSLRQGGDPAVKCVWGWVSIC
jgi:hypothetical protein